MYLKYFQHGYVFNDPIKPIWGNTVSEIVFKLNHTELSTLLSISCFRSSPSTWRTSAAVLSTWQYSVSLGPASLPRKCKLAALAFKCKLSIRLTLIHKLRAFSFYLPNVWRQTVASKVWKWKFHQQNTFSNASKAQIAQYAVERAVLPSKQWVFPPVFQVQRFLCWMLWASVMFAAGIASVRRE